MNGHHDEHLDDHLRLPLQNGPNYGQNPTTGQGGGASSAAGPTESKNTLLQGPNLQQHFPVQSTNVDENGVKGYDQGDHHLALPSGPNTTKPLTITGTDVGASFGAVHGDPSIAEPTVRLLSEIQQALADSHMHALGLHQQLNTRRLH